MKDKKTGVFFDIDGTLTRNSLMVDHFLRMVRSDVIDQDIYRKEIKPLFDDYKRRFIDYEEYLDGVSKLYMETIKGIKFDYIDYLAMQVVKDNRDIVYSFTRARIKEHLAKGDLVFFISGSPDFLVRQIAEYYSVTDFKGTEYILDKENRFTGDFVKMWDSASKEKILMKFVEDYNIDLDKSYAYGDTKGDISMLSKVKYPVAINPIKELLANIVDNKELKEKIKIIVERKDVIYTIPVAVLEDYEGFTSTIR